MSLEGRTAEEVQALAELANSLGNNPKTRQGLLTLTKMVNPDLSIPEIDTLARVNTLVKPFQDRIDAMEKKEQEREQRQRVEENRRMALKKGITEADLPAVEKIMLERKIADYETGADFFKMSQKAAEPTPSSISRTFGKPVLPDLKEFGGSLKEFGRAQARDMVDQFRGRKAA